MRKCIESLLKGGEDVEIIIVDDGSTDETPKIADEYAAAYPSLIKVIHKANGGHGSGVNAGLAAASGLYFKVVDSDDWVSERSLERVLRVIKQNYADGVSVDAYFVNYVYEHVADGTRHPVRYKNVFPKDRVFGWKNLKTFRSSQFITMHALIYNTEFLKKTGLRLPEHKFYVDNIFIMHPLPDVRTMYYINTDFYRYFIGRADQSVNENVLYRRIDQQDFVLRYMVDDFVVNRDRIKSRKLERYMVRHIAIITTIVTVFLTMYNREEDDEKKKALWRFIKMRSKKLYRELRCTTVAGFVSIPGKFGRIIALNGYKITQKMYKYN